MATHSSFRENALRVVAVIGLIAILLLGAWGIIQLAFYLPTFFSTLGRDRETITLTAPAQSTSDKAIAVSWKHTGQRGEYGYSLSYTCAPGLQFAVPVPTGAYQLVACDTQFNYINASSSMNIVPVLASGTKQASTTISVAATKLENGAVTVRGSARTTVAASTTVATTPAPAATPKPTATTKPSTTYVPSGRTTNLYGAADLSVQITQAPQVANVGSRVSVQFVVTNIGTNLAPAGWTLNATLPYTPIYVYPAGAQQKLYPGDKIVYTLGFDTVPVGGDYSYDYYSYGGMGGQAQVTIEVDPLNIVAEQSEYNNTAVSTYQVY